MQNTDINRNEGISKGYISGGKKMSPEEKSQMQQGMGRKEINMVANQKILTI